MLSQGRVGLLAMHFHFHYFPRLHKVFQTRDVFSLEGQCYSERTLETLPRLRQRLFVIPIDSFRVTDWHLPSKLTKDVLLWLWTSKSQQ